MTRLIAGIDEAGRGPVIGPLIIAGVLVQEDQVDSLIKIGVKDSKKLSPKRRAELSHLIKKIAVKLLHVEVPAEEIDNRIKKRITLNRLEARKIAYIVNRLHPDKAYIDCPDVNPSRFGEWLRNKLKYKEVEIIALNYADESIPVVSAASIMAKVRRDQRIKELAEELGEIGSGYPSDPRTRLYVQNVMKSNNPVDERRFLRSTWKTVKSLSGSSNTGKNDSTK